MSRSVLVAALPAAWLVAGCYLSHERVDASRADPTRRDAGHDAAVFDASHVVEAAADAQADAAADAACVLPPRPTFRCSGEYVMRGAPLTMATTAADGRTISSGGYLHHVPTGWAWLGYVREAPGSPHNVEYRVMRTDEHFTTLDASTIVRDLPRIVDGVERRPGYSLYVACSDQWLFRLASADDPSEYFVLYGSDGVPRSDVVGIPPSDPSIFGGGWSSDGRTLVGLTAEPGASSCLFHARTRRFDLADLTLLAASPSSDVEGRWDRGSWRDDHWLAIQTSCGSPDSSPVLWDWFPDRPPSSPRELTLPPLPAPAPEEREGQSASQATACGGDGLSRLPRLRRRGARAGCGRARARPAWAERAGSHARTNASVPTSSTRGRCAVTSRSTRSSRRRTRGRCVAGRRDEREQDEGRRASQAT